MKTCKSCIKEIGVSAIKCPYCQSYQVWYRNPQISALVFPLIYLPLMFYFMGIWFNKEYVDNEKLFNVQEISHAQDEYGRLAINYKIENSTDTKWHSVAYEVSFYDIKGNLLFVKTGQEYSWLIHPKQSALLTVDVDNRLKAEKWVFKIRDLKSGRF